MSATLEPGRRPRCCAPWRGEDRLPPDGRPRRRTTAPAAIGPVYERLGRRARGAVPARRPAGDRLPGPVPPSVRLLRLARCSTGGVPAVLAARGRVTTSRVSSWSSRSTTGRPHLGACLTSVLDCLAHPAVGVPPGRRGGGARPPARDGSAVVAERLLRPLGRPGGGGAPQRRGCPRRLGTGARPGGDRSRPVSCLARPHHADCEVPVDWVSGHLGCLARAAGVPPGWSRCGTGRLPRLHPPPASSASTGGRCDRPHPHVHGANLGVRASAYLGGRGFPPLAVQRGPALWDALRSATGAWWWRPGASGWGPATRPAGSLPPLVASPTPHLLALERRVVRRPPRIRSRPPALDAGLSA